MALWRYPIAIAFGLKQLQQHDPGERAGFPLHIDANVLQKKKPAEDRLHLSN